MGFIDVIKERAKAANKTIVLPETEDRRTYEAAAQILKEGIAKIILVGSEEAVKKGSEGLDLTGAVVVDPATSDRTQAYIDKLVELRQKKGMTPEQAKEILLNQYLYYHYFENIGMEKEKYLHDTELISALSFPYFSLLIIRHSTF